MRAVTPHDLCLVDGRTLRVYDCGPQDPDVPTILWHHGSPQSGAPLAPLVAAASSRGARLLSYARPSYGGSDHHRGRSVASAAGDVAQLTDRLGVDRFAVIGASGGGPHALACAASLPGRVTAAACLAGLAPMDGTPGWFAGMASPGGLQAALGGREERARYAATDEFDPGQFTTRDWEALDGRWAALGADAGPAGEAWPDGLIDDDVAFARPWGVDLSSVGAPVLLVQGDEDRVVPPAHARQLARLLPRAEVRLRPGDGHISVLDACPEAMDWLLAAAA